jgi:hypothetical protein
MSPESDASSSLPRRIRRVVSEAANDGASRWKTSGERTIYDNPRIWLGEVDVELPAGERFWHHVVRLHRAGMTALVSDDDQVPLLWRHRFVQDRPGWELPGGLIDEGGEPIETAARELEEETAVASDAWSTFTF